jgi:hypothetical protein
MTIAIILGIWFAISVIVSPLVGWLLFTLGKDQSNSLRRPQRDRPRLSFGKGIKFFAPHRHRDDQAPPVRRSARGR